MEKETLILITQVFQRRNAGECDPHLVVASRCDHNGAGKAKANNRDFQFWMQHNHPIEMNCNEIIDSRLEYIHRNPVSAGFVDEPGDWKYSSARDYQGQSGSLDSVLLE